MNEQGSSFGKSAMMPLYAPQNTVWQRMEPYQIWYKKKKRKKSTKNKKKSLTTFL